MERFETTTLTVQCLPRSLHVHVNVSGWRYQCGDVRAGGGNSHALVGKAVFVWPGLTLIYWYLFYMLGTP